MYRERMNSYYPEVVRTITDFQAIIESEYPEFENLEANRQKVLDDAHLITMNEYRIAEWEKILKIKPVEGSSVDDRRDTVIARIRGQGKLNTDTINSIVKTFTGGKANAWMEDSVLYVEITPPPRNKQFQFANVEQELSRKVPAHLGFQVKRNYYEWIEIKRDNVTWQDLKNTFQSWEDVCIYNPFK